MYSAEILRGAGIRPGRASSRIALTCHASKAEFAHNGIAVIPAPTGIPSREFGGPLDFLPSMAGLQGSYFTIYELAALVVLRLTPDR